MLTANKKQVHIKYMDIVIVLFVHLAVVTKLELDIMLKMKLEKNSLTGWKGYVIGGNMGIDKKAQGRASKRKGSRVERLAVKLFNEIGEARRIPLSGSIEGWKGDIDIRINDKRFVAEVKGRANGWKQIDKWIAEHDMLLLKPDNKPFYVIFTEDSFKQFVIEIVGER